MPECAEVKIMSEFINSASTNSFFERIEKSPVSKVKTELDAFGGGIFTVRAESRGKELKLTLELVGGPPEGERKTMLVTQGMSGFWIAVRRNDPSLERVLKHAHLRFISTRGDYLVLYDIRRFAKWRWSDWGGDRGPCPLTEYNDFVSHVKSNWQTAKAFRAPLNELLLNQSYFNGVGNYVRSEVLYRFGINPFTPAKDLTLEQLDELLKGVHTCLRDSYYLGGGANPQWYNPKGTAGNSFEEWMKCYGNREMGSIKDKAKRTFWYDPKWNSEAEAYLAG